MKGTRKEGGGGAGKREKEGREPHFGHPHSKNPSDMGIPWVGAKVEVYTGNAHITSCRVLGMGMHKTQACPCHCDTTALPFPQFPPVLFSCSRFLNPRGPDYLGAWNRLGKKGPDEYPTTRLTTRQHSTLRLSLPRSLAK